MFLTTLSSNLSSLTSLLVFSRICNKLQSPKHLKIKRVEIKGTPPPILEAFYRDAQQKTKQSIKTIDVGHTYTKNGQSTNKTELTLCIVFI